MLIDGNMSVTANELSALSLVAKEVCDGSMSLAQIALTISQARRVEELTKSGKGTFLKQVEEQEKERIHNQEISVLDLSVRTQKCLQHLRIKTLNDLTKMTEGDLLATVNFGQTSLHEVKNQLRRFDLGLLSST